MTQEQIETLVAAMRYVFPVLGALGPLFYVFVVSGAFLFLANVLLQGKTSYRHLTAAMAHIGMVTIPMLAVRIPLILANRDMDVQTSLAAFLPHAEEKGPLYYTLAQFDVFSLWMLGLCVLAVSILARVPLRRSAVGIIGAWVVWSLVWIPLAPKLGG
jgi:hypothetical protein